MVFEAVIYVRCGSGRSTEGHQLVPAAKPKPLKGFQMLDDFSFKMLEAAASFRLADSLREISSGF